MSEKKEKREDKKQLAVYIACAVIFIGIIIAIILCCRGQKLDESFFKTTDSKYVATFNDKNFGSEKTYYVIEHKDDKVTSFVEYFEFKDNESAKEVLDDIKKEQDNDAELDIKQNGKYLVYVEDVTKYEEISANDLIVQYNTLMKILNGENIDENNNESDAHEE